MAERGINGWKYIADEMGLSTAEVMKLSEQGAIDATTAINAVVKGMQTNFAGGMDAMSKTVPGLLSTIKDNAGMVMKEIGDKITTGLDLTGILTNVSNFLTQFSTLVKSVGISEAIKGLIPPEATAAVFAIAGALGGVATLAMYSFALATWAAIAPLLPFIALGAAVGLLAYEIWYNWEPLSGLFSELWSAISETFSAYWDLIVSVYSTAWEFISNIASTYIDAVVGVVFGGWDSIANGTSTTWNAITSIIGGAWDVICNIVRNGADYIVKALNFIGVNTTALENFVSTATNGIGKIQTALNKVDTSKLSLGIEKPDVSGLLGGGQSKPNRLFTGLHNSGTPANTAGKGGAGGGIDKATQEMEKLEKKSDQVSDSIEREWVQTTKTQLQQLDIWESEQISSLDETAGANENYERDKERISAVYSTRRTKIMQTEAKEAIDTFKTIRDGYMSIQKEITLGGLSGSAKDISSKGFDLADKAKGVSDYFEKITQDYETANDKQKQNILTSLNSMGIAYQQSENGRLDFSKVTDDAIAAYRKQSMVDTANYYATTKDIQSNIDAAYNANSMAMLQATLTEQNAIRMNDYAAQKSMMDTYQEVFLASNSTTAQLMSSLYSGAFGGLQDSISGLLDGTKSIDDAFESLGQTMLKVISDYIAKWLAGKLMMAIFGKTTMAAETAMSVAAGAATAAAWAPAAAMVSLATFGANSAPAMAGIAATAGLSMALSVPALANGGITTGPALALIGEGKSDEVVLPLNKKVFEKMGLTNNGDGGGSNNLAIHINALDGKSVEKWLNNGGGAKIQKFFGRQAGAFAVQGVT